MKYKLNNIKIYGYHGVYDNEIKDGQEFLINLSYDLTYSDNAVSDALNDVLDYKNVYDSLINIFNKHRFNLLESLSVFICKELKRKYSMNSISIEIIKKTPKKLDLVNSVSVLYEC